MSDRDYFPQPRTTRPRPDAPTMAEAILAAVNADERWYELHDGWVE